MKLEQHSPRLTIPVTEADHAQGPGDAPVTLVEYGDYECPYCGKAYPLVKEIRKRMGDRLRFVFRNTINIYRYVVMKFLSLCG